MTPEEIAKLPVTQTLFEYNGVHKRFAGIPGDWAVDEIAYGLPAPHRNRGLIYQEAARGGCCVNIGAHIGTTAIVAADFFFKNSCEACLFAFEPSSRNFALLQHNLKLNETEIIAVEQIAFSDHEYMGDLYLCPDSKSVCHSLSQGVAGTDAKEVVRVTTIDEHLRDLRDCGLLMIDAEGHDMKILQGGRTFVKKHRPLIIIEFAPQFWNKCGSTVQDLINFVGSLGDYRVCADFGNNFSPVSPAMITAMFAAWKDTCQGWIDLYLVPGGKFTGIFP